jgi:energy-converting hydrogenase Eha subunit A
VGVILFLLPANFLIAYSLGLTGQTDVKGHMTGFGTFSIFSAPVFASMVTGRIYEHYGYIASAWLGAVALVLATVIQAWLAAVVKKQSKTKEEVSAAHVNMRAI